MTSDIFEFWASPSQERPPPRAAPAVAAPRSKRRPSDVGTTPPISATGYRSQIWPVLPPGVGGWDQRRWVLRRKTVGRERRRETPGGEEIFTSAQTPAGVETPALALAPGQAMSS